MFNFGISKLINVTAFIIYNLKFRTILQIHCKFSC